MKEERCFQTKKPILELQLEDRAMDSFNFITLFEIVLTLLIPSKQW